jgi:hypothetical protein
MQWPDVVQQDQIQSRLILDGIPVERAMKVSSETARLQLGDRYRIERTEGDVFLYAQGAGMFVTSGK